MIHLNASFRRRGSNETRNLSPFHSGRCLTVNDLAAMDDWQLLNDYATRNSDDAFRTLVERYAAMVYHAALRQVGNPQAAQEVTQGVFIALAQSCARTAS